MDRGPLDFESRASVTSVTRVGREFDTLTASRSGHQPRSGQVAKFTHSLEPARSPQILWPVRLRVVPPGGLEPPTSGLRIRCSAS